MILLDDRHQVSAQIVAVKILLPEHIRAVRAFKVDEPAQAVQLRLTYAELTLDVALALDDQSQRSLFGALWRVRDA